MRLSEDARTSNSALGPSYLRYEYEGQVNGYPSQENDLVGLRPGYDTRPGLESWHKWHTWFENSKLKNASLTEGSEVALTCRHGSNPGKSLCDDCYKRASRQLQDQRKDIRDGIQFMNLALDEAFHASKTTLQGPQYILKIEEQLHDIIHGCEYVHKKAQHCAACESRLKDCKGKEIMSSSWSSPPGTRGRPLPPPPSEAAEYSSINTELTRVADNAVSLLDALRKRKYEQPGVFSRWFPFLNCCTKRPTG